MRCLALITGLALLPVGAYAHDTGHHADITRDALREAGFQDDATRSVQVLNFLTDYFSNDVFADVNPALGAVRAEVEKLHFDNLGDKLDDYDSIASYWSHLASNTRDAARKAASDHDTTRLLAVLGISLHAVQDFYSHTNWVETHPRASGSPYRSETWFSELPMGPIAGLKSGHFPDVAADPAGSHGGYSGPGMNHDSYVRPRWDEGYAFAYAASVQWIAAVRAWVEEVDPAAWSAAQTLAAPQGLDADAAAMYRISEWIKSGPADGHWKGNGSGSLADLVPFALAWTTATDSPLVAQFKQARTQEALTPGLYTGQAAADPPAIRRVAVSRETVQVYTQEVKEKDDVGLLEPKIDVMGSPDFYSIVSIDGLDYTEAMQINRATIHPSWTSFRFLPRGTATVGIVYRLFDEDGGVFGDDDHCDINPAQGQRDLSISFPLSTGSQAFHSEGAKPDKDRAVVSIRVRADSLAPLPALTIQKAVGQGGTNQKADVAVVQELLNAVPPAQGGPDIPLAIDGLIGPKAIAAIKKFQAAGTGAQDSRVDPGQGTLKRLNAF